MKHRSRYSFIVIADKDQSVEDMTSALTSAGFIVDEINDNPRGITGAATEDVAERVRSFPGVTDVIRDVPDEDIKPPITSDHADVFPEASVEPVAEAPFDNGLFRDESPSNFESADAQDIGNPAPARARKSNKTK